MTGDGDGGLLGWKNWKYPITFFHNRETTPSEFKGELKERGLNDFVIGQYGNPVVHPDTSIAYDLLHRNVTPRFKHFFTDVMATQVTTQNGGICQDFELRAMECIEYFGMKQGLDACKDFYDDFLECNLKTKQQLRLMHMRRKRHRDNWFEYLQGKRTKEELYEPPPKMNAYVAPWTEEKYQGAWFPNM